jgi:hypothetical protein
LVACFVKKLLSVDVAFSSSNIITNLNLEAKKNVTDKVSLTID